MSPGHIVRASVHVVDAVISRQREIERRALADLAIGPNTPAMPRDYLFDRCEPDPIAGKIGAVQPLKYAKQFAGVTRVKANSVVAYEINSLVVFRVRADF